jgi:hypothetical protein
MKMNPDKFQAIAIGKNTQSKNISFNLNGKRLIPEVCLCKYLATYLMLKEPYLPHGLGVMRGRH